MTYMAQMNSVDTARRSGAETSQDLGQRVSDVSAAPNTAPDFSEVPIRLRIDVT